MDLMQTDFCARLFEATSIPMALTRSDGSLIATTPSTLGQLIPKQFVSYCVQDFELQKRDSESPLVLLMEPSFFIGIAKLTSEEYFILGPAGPFVPTQEQILSFAMNVIYPEKLVDFCDLLISIPTVTYRRFISTLSLAVQLYTGKIIALEDIVLCNNTAEHVDTEDELKNQLFSQREHSISHTPQSYEIGVLSAIEAGDVPLLKRRIVEPIIGRIGCMAQDALVQEKYTFVSFTTMVTRAAIKGGLNTETAFTLSDAYCHRMDTLVRIQDISALTYQMALDFCQKVSDMDRRKHCTPMIQKVQEYISTNLHNEIHLNELANLTGLCTRVLSKKFRDETGVSVNDYIHGQRMREAEHLLAHSTYCIAEIASFLQYSSQSYFTKLFGETFGITPQQFREKGRCDLTAT